MEPRLTEEHMASLFLEIALDQAVRHHRLRELTDLIDHSLQNKEKDQFMKWTTEWKELRQLENALND